MAEKDRT